MAKAGDLESMSIRPGQARGLPPETVAGGPVPSRQDAAAPILRAVPAEQTEQAAGQGEEQSAPSPATSHKAGVAKRQEAPKPRTIQIGARVPEDIAKGIKWCARLQGVEVQKLTADVLEAGLRTKFGDDWRRQLDEEVKSWRTLDI